MISVRNRYLSRWQRKNKYNSQIMEEYFVYGLKITKSKAKQKVLDTSDSRLFY